MYCLKQSNIAFSPYYLLYGLTYIFSFPIPSMESFTLEIAQYSFMMKLLQVVVRKMVYFLGGQLLHRNFVFVKKNLEICL